MFGSLGFTEIAFILLIALLLFGPKQLPEIGKTLGKALQEFRRASNELKRTWDAEAAELERASQSAPVLAPVPPVAAAIPAAATPAEATTPAELAPAPAGEPSPSEAASESTPELATTAASSPAGTEPRR